MTEDKMLELWDKSGGDIYVYADLVADHEREECVVVAEEWFCGCGRGNCPEGDLRANDIAVTIRARGQE